MRSFSLVTYGCQMNQHDSERIGELLCERGHAPAADLTLADIVVVNTCSVRGKAEQKLMSDLGRLSRLKRRRPGLTLVVAGCVAQQHGARLVARVPAVDIVIGPDNIRDLPDLLEERGLRGRPQVLTQFDLDHPRFVAARPAPGRGAACAYVTIMKGCNERCSFCIVPQTRGPERYRACCDIVAEVQNLVAAGTAEVTLLGQTVNSYVDPEGALDASPDREGPVWKHTHPSQAARDRTQFAALLCEIARRVPELRRLRYTSPHPRHLTGSLISAHAELGVLARHMHLPVQSGSDRILRRMIRRHTVAEYVERVEKLRQTVPDLTLSTDVIVGFPGETRSDFEQTLNLVERMRFSGLYGFKYSPRPATPALALGDDVDEDEKSARLTELFALYESQRQAHLDSLVGTRQVVLVEGRGPDGRLTGRTERNEIVHLDADECPLGQLVDVVIRRAFKNSLEGHWRPTRATEQSRRVLPVVAG
jgi:tRNA-2-methylthio-N6-dimethylallyladenosine synthase